MDSAILEASVLKISNDEITRAIQKDVHREMESRGVANFFDFGAEVVGGISPNTFRNLIENGNWHKDHFESLMKQTKATHLKEVFRKWSEQ